jgi:hypothetical protein
MDVIRLLNVRLPHDSNHETLHVSFSLDHLSGYWLFKKVSSPWS